jgi:UDP-3-O-[3-hydroxymyristoyl] glucosamine N-acyltransferase
MKDKRSTGITIQQLAQQMGAELVGDGAEFISGVGTIETADENQVAFLSHEKYISKLPHSKAGAIITSEKIDGFTRPQLIVKNVEAGLIKALSIFAPKLAQPKPGIDPRATVANTAKVSQSASIGPHVHIAEDAEVGGGSIIAAGCKIGRNSKIGDNCRLDCNVVVYHNCTIGNNVIVQASSTIGSTGFGYSFIDGAHRLIPHNGGVIIENYVEIGANCSVDRAKFGNTIIGAGTKIDNLVQIAHNVIIGKCCLFAAQVGIAGSCEIGDGVVLAGQVGVGDHVKIGDGVIVGARAAVIQNVKAGQKMLGVPAIELKRSLKTMKIIPRLPEIVKQIRELSTKVKELENLRKS